MDIKGKIPPQAKDLEKSIIGAMMVDSSGISEVIEMLFQDAFYDSKHQLIFKAIYDLYVANAGVDLLTVSEKLLKDGNLDKAGGDFYLINLTQVVASSAHIEYHSRIVLQKYIQRELIRNSEAIIENCYDETSDVFESLDNAYNHLNDVSEISVRKQESSFKSIKEKVIERGVKIFKGEVKAGIETPIKNLTNKTGGWRDSELIILAARPGMGKTSFALKIAVDPAKKGIPTAFFSLEMSNEQLASRILSMEYKIDGQKFNSWGLNEQDKKKLDNNLLDEIPLYIDDTPSLTIEQFQIIAKRLKSKHGIKLIVIDYLQLMSGKSNNREQEISKISRGLKKVAKELNVPVIALSQLSRAVETRGGSKRPLLSDLRESGAIEQDADMVMFLYRPEYYGEENWDDDYDNLPCAGECEYIVEKNRNGSSVRNRMKFEGRYTSFSDLDTETNNQQETDVPIGDLKDAFEDAPF